MRDRFLNNPIALGRYVVKEMFTYPSPDFHYELTRGYLNREPKMVIRAPRGHAKSSLVACVWVLHHLFCEDPLEKKFVVLVSKTEGHAKRLLQTIMDVLDYSVPFRKVFGYWGRLSCRVAKTEEVQLKNGSLIMTRGTAQQVLGLKHIHTRPTLIILDDPEDEANTRTPEAMEYNLRWFLTQLMPTRGPRSRVIVIGTPQKVGCMVEVLAGTRGWSSYHYSALMDGDTRALWPDGPWPLERLKKEKDEYESNGRLSYFLREYQCLVTSDEDAVFAPSMIKTYAASTEFVWVGGRSYLFNAGIYTAVVPFMGIDPAVSTGMRADYTAIVPVAVNQVRDVFLLPYVHRRMRPTETIDMIKAKAEEIRPALTLLEATAAQETFRDILMKMDDVMIPGLSMKMTPRDRKSKRYLEVLQPYFSRGKVYLKPGMRELEQELLSYREDGSGHDDLLDALYYALLRSYPPGEDHVESARLLSNPRLRQEVSGRKQEEYTSWAIA